MSLRILISPRNAVASESAFRLIQYAMRDLRWKIAHHEVPIMFFVGQYTASWVALWLTVYPGYPTDSCSYGLSEGYAIDIYRKDWDMHMGKSHQSCCW